MTIRLLLISAFVLVTGVSVGYAGAKKIPKGLKLACDYGAKWCYGGRYRSVQTNGEIFRQHRGIDFKARPGTPVIAGADGWISTVGIDKCGGGFAYINSEFQTKNRRTGKTGIMTLAYFHIIYHVGHLQRVKAGDVIGIVAPKGQFAGRCIGPVTHVHFTIRVPTYLTKDHTSPHPFWVDGHGRITCWRKGMTLPKGKIVAPLLCN